MRYLLFAFVSAAFGQSISPIAPATAQRGTNFTLTITHSLTSPVALQWSLTLPSGWTSSTPSTSVPNKTIVCNSANTTCVLYGGTSAGANVAIPAGPIATFSIAVPVSAALGNATISTTSTLGASKIPVVAITASGGSATLSVTSDPRDIDGNGVIDQTDVNLALTHLFTVPTLPELVTFLGVLFKALSLVP